MKMLLQFHLVVFTSRSLIHLINIGNVLSFFLGVLLFSKKNKVLSDTILSIWLMIIGIHLTSSFLYYNGYWEIYPHLIGITAPFPLFYGPFLYLYVLYSIKSKSKLKSLLIGLVLSSLT